MDPDVPAEERNADNLSDVEASHARKRPRDSSLLISTGLIFLFLYIVFTLRTGNLGEARAYEALYVMHDDVVVGLVWPFASRHDYFQEGALMAVDEVNAAGGILGRKIVVRMEDDENDPVVAKSIAHKWAKQTDMVAVIGHFSSDVAVPLSIIYHYAGMLYISPAATDPKLTIHKFPMVFGSMPNDNVFGMNLINFRSQQGFEDIERIVILHSDDIDGRSAAVAAQEQIAKSRTNMAVVGRLSFRAPDAQFRSDEMNFRTLLADLNQMEFDAVYLACKEPPAGQILRQARELGVDQPFIGSIGLDTLDLWKSAGRAADGTLIASVYNPNDTRAVVTAFQDNFRARYGREADPWAAQAYDAVHLMALAMNNCASTVPSVVASTLKLNTKMDGVTGSLDFNDEYGSMTGSNLVFKILYDGQWVYP